MSELICNICVDGEEVPLYGEWLETNDYLSEETLLVWNYPYLSYYSDDPRHPRFLNILKNDFDNADEWELEDASSQAYAVLQATLEKLAEDDELSGAVVCAVPRSKVPAYYSLDQVRFYSALWSAVEDEGSFINGVGNFYRSRGKTHLSGAVMERNHNVITTHLSHGAYQEKTFSWLPGGEPEQFYPGVTTNTCKINSRMVRGKVVILVDDIYTRTVNVDEDAIEALYDAGARRVILYTVAKTMRKSKNILG